MVTEVRKSTSPDADTLELIDDALISAEIFLRGAVPGQDFMAFSPDGRWWKISTWYRDDELKWIRFVSSEDLPDEEAYQLGQLREPYPHADHIRNGELTHESPLEVAYAARDILDSFTWAWLPQA